MKIKIEIDESAAEDEVIIRCRGLTKQVAAVQRAVRDVTNASEKILLYKGNTEYYVTLSKILFFETDENGISAHTRDEVYQTPVQTIRAGRYASGRFYESIQIHDLKHGSDLLY